ncbi:MAG: alpha/beta hydrolase-fold protein [Phycisphaerae bacterium]
MLLAVVLPASLAGCPVTASLPDDAPIRELTVHETDAPFYLYVPSQYTPARRWPLVVLCHGTNPFDTAWLQMKEWAQFAEDHKIIIAAPKLIGVRGDFPPPAAEQHKHQAIDEQTILGVVAAVRAAYNVAEERVFLTGWSAGGYAVLNTGLRHPEVFRALAVRQGNFEPEYLEGVEHRLDRWQPIFVFYGSMDPIGEQSRASVEWLRDRDMFVKELARPGVHRRLPVSIAWDFFEDTFKNRPWIRLSAVVPDYRRPRRVRFAIRAAPAAVDARWSLGDETELSGLQPAHDYQADGTYDVTARVRLKNGKWYRRNIAVRVPRTSMGLVGDPALPDD